ncbi:hypothetical protein L915_21997 [Phytophthora nicotianae]|uniref:Uncharacterized protein n=1 Tax=Phytophthora nicotianae TaxID=4792 RepID=W2FL68_PHYNI|nr:hypothetical protein L915_21997 [Phytophthora nicotianae]
MVSPTPKALRYQLTAHERQLCHEALLNDRHERRIRRDEQKDTKKAAKKKAAKHTTPAMEIPHAGGEAAADAKEKTSTGRATAEDKETSQAGTAAEAKGTPDLEPAVSVVVADMVASVAIAAMAAQPDAAGCSTASSSTGNRKRNPQAPAKSRCRAVLQDNEEDGGSISYVIYSYLCPAYFGSQLTILIIVWIQYTHMHNSGQAILV